MTPLHLVFNDLSAQPLAEQVHSARARLTTFVNTLSDAPDHGLGRFLRIPETFYALPITENYTVSNWLDDKAVSREETSLLLQIATLAPFLKDTSHEIKARDGDLEVKYEGVDNASLRAARILEVPLISLHHNHWSDPVVKAQEYWIDSACEVATQNISLINISESGHFQTHRDWISDRRARQITNMSVLWENRQTIFPHIDFAAGIKSQILEIAPQHEAFSFIIARLFEMERHASDRGAAFDPSGFSVKCHPSSTSTLQMFVDDYTFRAETGVRYVCGWHFYLPSGWRMYFTPNNERFVIGHIGKHLPTRLFPS